MTSARLAVAAVALLAIGWAIWQMEGTQAGLRIEERRIGVLPVTLYAPGDGASRPAVVVAHGFAGSRALMEPFAVTLAQAGYSVLSLDFPGHGANPDPLAGDILHEDGASRHLLAALGTVIDAAEALPGTDGRIALLGHSMASDIVVRAAVADPRVDATVAVSMFSRAVTAEAPRNLLIVTGGWERFLSEAALDALALSAGEGAEEAVTYGRHGDGTARRVAFADSVEHVGVLYSPESLAEARAWLDATFDLPGVDGPLDARGPAVLALLAGIVALGWPLASRLPRLSSPSVGAGLPAQRLLALEVAAALATPLLLWPVPDGLLPVLVADYLALHFAIYGALLWAGLASLGRLPRRLGGPAATLAAAAAMLALTLGALGWALDTYVASFAPHTGRLWLIGALLVGTLPYMLAEEWATRGPGAPGWGPALGKTAMLASLALAVALDLESLFFLIIILPVVLLFFLLYGLFAGWAYRATGQPAVAGLANAVAFAWALGVTFPLLAA